MSYNVDMDVEIDVQNAFEHLTRKERECFIDENVDEASDESLIDEIRYRGLKLANDANYKELVNRASAIFSVGGMAARDFLTDCLGLQHTVSVDVIINRLKSILQ